MTAHDPQRKMVNVSGFGKRWLIFCPCGNTPARRLDADEAKEEMLRHPVSGVTG